MISNQYLRTYLYDIVGMTIAEARNHLKDSPASKYFRSMRTVEDVFFNKEVHQTETSWVTGRDSPVFKPEEFKQGRITVKVKNGIIKDALLEHGAIKLGPAEWPAKPYKGMLFALADPEWVGHIPIKQDVKMIPRSIPQKGWTIGNIKTMSIVNGKSKAPDYILPKLKSYVKPRFGKVEW